jgi:hypothetical protein
LTQTTSGINIEDHELEELENESDEGDLIMQVYQFAQDNLNIESIHHEGLSEESTGYSKDTKYIFCPIEHDLPILHLFTCHHAPILCSLNVMELFKHLGTFI